MRIFHIACRVMITCSFLLCFLLGVNSDSVAMAVSMTRAAAVQSATIINSGSTNTCPYRIDVQDNGHVNYQVCDRSGHQEISPSLAAQFFNDLNVAAPLNELPFIRCQKSISFGSTTVISYAGTRSPDLSCPSLNVYVFHLYDDIETIRLSLSLCLLKRSTCN
jgi:hypothetical protein